MRHDTATVAELDRFDALVDVRSPAEFAEDHIPGAASMPVLDDAERAHVGTLYKQSSPFLARKVGAALVARNIARHLEARLLHEERRWRPLVYCWRGGQRSGAMTVVLRQVGWDARQLEGGYKAFRRHVIAELESLPGRYAFRVLCGLTGSGKSRLLEALAAHGAQTLDLEALAAHRGSVLGNRPDTGQPAQRLFESWLWDALRRLEPGRPVYVEAESKKIGRLRVPEPIITRIRAADCVRIEAEVDTRVALLLQQYAHYLGDVPSLAASLETLAPLHGHARIAAWLALAEAGRWQELVADLLERHYDPAYGRSTAERFAGYGQAPRLRVPGPDDAAFEALAAQLVAGERAAA
jgi:tRNA 2-selenouridine synthase